MRRLRGRRSSRAARVFVPGAWEQQALSVNELRALPGQVLRLRCEQEHLVSSGTKAVLVTRLADHCAEAQQTPSDPDAGNGPVPDVSLAALAAQVADLQRQLASSHGSGDVDDRRHVPETPAGGSLRSVTVDSPPIVTVSSPCPLTTPPATVISHQQSPLQSAPVPVHAVCASLGLLVRTTDAIQRGEFVSFSVMLAELAAGSPAFSVAYLVDAAMESSDETFSLARNVDSGSFNLVRTSSAAKPKVADFILGCRLGVLI